MKTETTTAASGKRALTPPQKLSVARRKTAIEGVSAKRARAIAAAEPVAAKVKRGKTKKPLAKERVAEIP